MKPKFIYNPGYCGLVPLGVNHDDRVLIIWRSGTKTVLDSKAGIWNWKHTGWPSDIIAYRVIGEEK